MPPLPDQDQPIEPLLAASVWQPAHPSPHRDKLMLERRSVKERGWWGHRFGIDTPYWYYPLGWGEWEPLVDSVLAA